MQDAKSPHSPNEPPKRHGVIAVICRQQSFLVIRRSQTVTAPGAYCFPGGSIEEGESESDALVRELKEELDIDSSRLLRRLGDSQSRRGVQLAWWSVTIDDFESLRPDPAEVAEVHWWTIDEMRATQNLLDSNEEFLQKWERGEFA